MGSPHSIGDVVGHFGQARQLAEVGDGFPGIFRAADVNLTGVALEEDAVAQGAVRGAGVRAIEHGKVLTPFGAVEALQEGQLPGREVGGLAHPRYRMWPSGAIASCPPPSL